MQLSRAKALDVPDEMKGAQQLFLYAMQLRHDGVADIAANIQRALGNTTNKDAINAMAIDMARFYSSDVTYKEYATHLVTAALRGAGIAVGAQRGPARREPVPAGPQLASAGLHRVQARHVAAVHRAADRSPRARTVIRLTPSASAAPPCRPARPTRLPASPPPTFTLSFTNGGQNDETNVVCKVSVSSTKISGQTTVPKTTAGQSTTCRVPLSSSPPAGNYTVTATIQPVRGEKNTSNNTLTFPVTFG